MTLSLAFCSERRVVPTGETVAFGRDPNLNQYDVAVDEDNQFLHRRLGVVSHVGGLWWLSNVGSRTALRLCDRLGGAALTLPPGTSLPITFERCDIRFSAGRATYEIEVTVSPVSFRLPTAADGPLEGNTTSGSLRILPDDLLLILALAEPSLRLGGTAELPSNAAVARRLGWSEKQFDGRLDRLSAKLAAAGVPGFGARSRGLATGRRQALVDYAITTGLVNVDQLDQLPPWRSPSSEARP